jgi:Transcriptional activator, adenine-specific DNA methyltransferase
MHFPSEKYRTIYADPLWPERGGGKIKRGADRHYDLMTVKDIMALPVSSISEDNAHLYLWTTNNYLLDALRVMIAWGFDCKTIITWAKDKIGLGQYFRGQTEHCLFGVRGNLPYKMIDGKRQQGTTLILAPRTIHSRKPNEMRQMIETVSYGPYIELFAREHFDGWIQIRVLMAVGSVYFAKLYPPHVTTVRQPWNALPRRSSALTKKTGSCAEELIDLKKKKLVSAPTPTSQAKLEY